MTSIFLDYFIEFSENGRIVKNRYKHKLLYITKTTYDLICANVNNKDFTFNDISNKNMIIVAHKDDTMTELILTKIIRPKVNYWHVVGDITCQNRGDNMMLQGNYTRLEYFQAILDKIESENKDEYYLIYRDVAPDNNHTRLYS